MSLTAPLYIFLSVVCRVSWEKVIICHHPFVFTPPHHPSCLPIYLPFLSPFPFTFFRITGETLSNQLQACFTLLVGLIIGFTASWKITLVVIATFPVNVKTYMHAYLECDIFQDMKRSYPFLFPLSLHNPLFFALDHFLSVRLYLRVDSKCL